MESLHKEIGTAKDNRTSPVHDWYRFTAGFSYKLVEKIIEEETLGAADRIYESFAGCGTTLVSAQKKGISAIGHEGQELLFDVINAKLNWEVEANHVSDVITHIKSRLIGQAERLPYHELLKTLYSAGDLYELYVIKDYLENEVTNENTYLFLKLALTQTLHKVSIHPIAVPYISRSKTLSSTLSAAEMFEKTVNKMIDDLKGIENKQRTSEIFLHDSRLLNAAIPDNHCTICITSPPYLNNLDYGEVSKVCSHFYGITDSWNDVTEKVRKKLVTGATTHYKKSDFSLDEWKKGIFYENNKVVLDGIMPNILAIGEESKKRKGKKSFDILSLYYFEDMYKVLLEMRRILRPGSKAYLVLGDSAPYGVYLDTIAILGQIACRLGFNNYRIVPIRVRGTKWMSLKYRHNLQLSESILIIE